MKTLAIVGTNTLLSMARNMVDRGELTTEQYREMHKRNDMLSPSIREDIVVRT